MKQEIIMNTNTTTVAVSTFDADLAIAAAAVVSLKVKGDRADMVNALLTAGSADERDAVIEGYAAGELRRGLRHFALVFEGKGEQEIADAFWALRDDIDEDDDTMFRVDTEVAA
jgi:hypothetical protein